MEGRVRRFRRRARVQTLLPLRSTRLSNTISCWYCDVKISSLNEPLYRFGQKHARFLRLWFTVGIGFSLSVLFGVAMVLIWESVTTLFLPYGSKTSDIFSSLLFGFNPSVFIFKMSLIDVGYLIASTMISVAVHEFGHAVAAARELSDDVLSSFEEDEDIEGAHVVMHLKKKMPNKMIKNKMSHSLSSFMS